MEERIILDEVHRVPVRELEGLVQERIGWADRVISPFAAAPARPLPPDIQRPAPAAAAHAALQTAMQRRRAA